MQISLYIGKRKKKDKIVNAELLKYIEGDRSDRIKDLILKGLIFEGKKNIDDRLLDMRYAYDSGRLYTVVTTSEDEVSSAKMTENIDNDSENNKPDFTNIKIERSEIEDDDLESRI